jgi:hypothetical protein
MQRKPLLHIIEGIIRTRIRFPMTQAIRAALLIPAVVATILAPLLIALPVGAQSSMLPFSFLDSGGISLMTDDKSPALHVGYARISESEVTPAGFAIFGLRQNNTVISEATVPAANLIREGRIYADIGDGVNTGVAFANTNNESVQIAFYFTDSAGSQLGANAITIPPNGQIARFLTEPPFNGGSAFLGTFTFFTLSPASDLPVAAIALRGFTNERGEFLMTTLPVTPVGQRGLFSGDTIPHFATGGGWATQIILVNPTDAELRGTIAFTDQTGQLAVIDTENGPGALFSYRVAARSSWRLRTSNAGSSYAGSVRIRTSTGGSDIPIGFLIFRYRSATGITVTEAGVPPARSAGASRLFVETAGEFDAGQPGSLQTGIAISNAASLMPVRVSFDLTTLSGTSTDLHGTLDIPGGGQIARFLNQVPGLESLPFPFQGVLRISAPSAVTAIGLRARHNERGDFLVTTVPVINENDDYFNFVLRYSKFVFPHFADGDGYTTQFVLFSGWQAGSSSGTLQFLTTAGDPFPLTLQPR